MQPREEIHTLQHSSSPQRRPPRTGRSREIQASNVEPFFIATVEIQRYIFNDDAGANGRKPRCVLFERIRTRVIARSNGYFFAITAFPIEITTSIHIAFIISKTNPCAHDEPPVPSALGAGIKLPAYSCHYRGGSNASLLYERTVERLLFMRHACAKTHQLDGVLVRWQIYRVVVIFYFMASCESPEQPFDHHSLVVAEQDRSALVLQEYLEQAAQHNDSGGTFETGLPVGAGGDINGSLC